MSPPRNKTTFEMCEMYARSTRVLPEPVWNRACQEIDREIEGWLTEMTDRERFHWMLCDDQLCTLRADIEKD